jgi:1-phosphofructokinase family hexose kinase
MGMFVCEYKIMIVTVTPNTSIDRILFIPSFELNKTICTTQSVVSMGAKGTDVSWILGELGIPSLALGFAAGIAGKQVVELLHNKGVETDFVWVAGETRVNTLIVCKDGSGQSTIKADTLVVSEEDVDKLWACYLKALPEATCVVLGGTLPPNVDPSLYIRLIQAARQRAIPVILDSSGPSLRAGLTASPTVIKPNREEIEELTGLPAVSMESVYRAARKLKDRYGTSVVITLGEQGALALLPQHTYQIPPLNLEVINTGGAGDAVSAGIAAALSQNLPLEYGLRLGIASASAVCLTPGTAECRHEDIQRLLPDVQLIPYPPDIL